MTMREEFEAWFDKEYRAARDHQLPALIDELREVKWIVWQAAYSAALEEAAKQCDRLSMHRGEMGQHEASEEAEACADAIRALKD